MTVVLIDGFDNLSASQFTLKGWSANVSSVNAGNPDGNAARLSNAGAGTPTKKTLPLSYATVIVGFAYRANTFATTNTIFRLLNGSTRVADLQLIISGSQAFLRVLNAAGSTVASGSTLLSVNTWNYIELKVTVGTSGTAEVKLNGATEISSTVGNFGTSNVDSIQMMNSNSNGSTVINADFDDLYVIDTSTTPNNTYLADATHTPHVQTIYPSADGAHTDWTPDTGTSHFARVDENPPDGDTSFVSASTVGLRDSYAFGDLTSLTGVKCVQVSAYARKDDIAGREIELVSRPGSTDHDGASQTLTTSYAFYVERSETNPDTSAAWTTSDVNGAEFGIKVSV